MKKVIYVCLFFLIGLFLGFFIRKELLENRVEKINFQAMNTSDFLS